MSGGFLSLRITFAYALAEEGDRRAVAEGDRRASLLRLSGGAVPPPTVFRPVQLYPGGLGGK